MIDRLKLSMKGDELRARVTEEYRLGQSDLQFAEWLPAPPTPEPPICLGRR